MRIALLCLVSILTLRASDSYPEPRFTDPERRAKLQTAFSEIDQIFEKYAKARSVTGIVWGIVVDADLAHVKAIGVRDRASGDPVTPDTVFRIASMTKSFTTL